MSRSEDLYCKSALALFFIFCFCITLPLLAGAAPSIHIVKGSVFDGNAITIKGTNFGNNGPSIVIFDDFEDGEDGLIFPYGDNSRAKVGKWEWGSDHYAENSSYVYYTASVSHSGALAYQGCSGTCEGCDPRCDTTRISVGTSFPPTKEIFGCWWVYLPEEDEWPGAGPHGVNWKQIWVNSSRQHGGNDIVVCTILYDDKSDQQLGLVTGNRTGGYTKYGFKMNKGQWTRMMIYWVGSGFGKGICRAKYLNYDGITTITDWRNDTNITNMSKDDGLHDYTIVEMGTYCKRTYGSISHPTFDDFHFASGPNCRARVEIGDKDTYEACTNLTITTPTAWQDREITTAVRRGSLAPCKTYYLYVFNADGNVNAEGFPVYLVTSSGEKPCPPRGLTIIK